MKFSRIAAALALMSLAGAAVAAPAPALYCNSHGGVAAGTPGNGLAMGNMTLNGVAADNCFGHVNVNDYAGNGQNTTVIGDFANGSYQGGTALWGGGWDFIVRDDGPDSIYSHKYQGFRFDLMAPQGVTAGTWTLSVTDLTPAAAPYLPVTMDLLVFIKGGTEGDFFFFDDEQLNGSNSGNFTMSFRNGNGVSGLSGFSVLARDLTGSMCAPGNPSCGGEPGRELPEPNALLLAGLALCGVWCARRQRRQG